MTRPEKFQLHISERGAKFVEQIEVNKGKDAAYFQVPPHNGLSETDDMYDFKIVRNKVQGFVNYCHIQNALPLKMPGALQSQTGERALYTQKINA